VVEAAVDAGAGAAAAVAAAVVDADECIADVMHRHQSENSMNAGYRNSIVNAARLALCALLAVGVNFAIAADKPADKGAAKPAMPKTGTQTTFATPEEAADALVKAVKAGNRGDTLLILGAQAGGWISSGDKVADRATAERFAAAYDAKHSIARDGDKATLVFGPDDYPFAFPIVKSGERWKFDTEAGHDELLARRIGENELTTLQVMQAIVDAQMEYASADRNKDGVRDYAMKFASSPGKRDGLYWPVKEGEEPSPLGPLVVQAAGEGYGKNKPTGASAYHGYRFKMLRGQGKNAQGGALDYVVKGYAIGGFAVLAYPAKYANSGIMSFIVNHDGTIYQKDLGPGTEAAAQKIVRFDPGPGWSEVKAK
jgi:hypothetical protein